MNMLDCQIVKVPDLKDTSEAHAAQHSKIAELVKSGWTIAGFTTDDKSRAIWVRAKINRLWRVTNTAAAKTASQSEKEAIVVAVNKEAAIGQASLSHFGFHPDDLTAEEIDMDDPKNYGTISEKSEF